MIPAGLAPSQAARVLSVDLNLALPDVIKRIMPISLSESARERVQEFLLAQPDALGLRFGVKRTGCSGWAYVVDIAAQQAPNDSVFDASGVRVLVDDKSLRIVDGTEIDFARKGLNAEFVFRNPNVKAACGCGESFTIEEKFA